MQRHVDTHVDRPAELQDEVAALRAELRRMRKMTEDHLTMIDINAPVHGVDISVSNDGRTVWVNVDGLCRLRICQIERLELTYPLANATGIKVHNNSVGVKE